MGLIRTAIESVKGTLQDQYKTAISCEDMGNELLMSIQTRQNGIIRNGSLVVVNPAQVAVIIDNGRVIDASAEPGVYEFQSDASPSFFAGNFGGVFREMWTRFVFGGATYQDQAVYFINTREIINNGFGTPAPVMYRDWEHCMADARRGGMVPMRVAIKCAGNYTFMIDQPWGFLQRVGGTANSYYKDEITQQMRVEIVSTFQAVLNSLCDEKNKVFPLDLPAKSFYIKELMDKQVFDEAIRARGMRIAGFNVLSVNLDDESKAKIDAFEASGDISTQQAKLYSAMRDAAGNEAGAGVGFLNLSMMNNAAGSIFPGALAGAMPPQNAPAPVAPPLPAAPGTQPACTACAQPVAGKFCAHCGAPAPLPAARFCANCGAATGGGKFCQECGAPQA